MWLKIKEEGQTAGFGPFFPLAYFGTGFFEPQPYPTKKHQRLYTFRKGSSKTTYPKKGNRCVVTIKRQAVVFHMVARGYRQPGEPFTPFGMIHLVRNCR